MIITCEKCGTRFNLDESLLDTDGSKVRCSRCQNMFTAFPPPPEPEFDNLEFNDTDFDEDEILTQDDFRETSDYEELELEAIDPDEIEIEIEEADTATENESNLTEKLELEELDLSEEPDPAVEAEKEPEFDLAFDLDEKETDTAKLDLEISEDREPDISDQKVSFPLEESELLKETTMDDVDEEEDVENEEQAFEGLDDIDDPDFDEPVLTDTDSSETSPHEPPPPRRPARVPLIQPLGQENAFTDVEEEPSKKRSFIGLPVLVILVLFLLAAGGYLAATFMGYKIPFLSGIQIPFIQQYLPDKTPDPVSYPDPIPDQKSVTGRFITNDTAGELFIITGKIENPAKIPYRRIQVKGTLFRKDKQAIMSQTVFCGNIISEDALRTSPIQELTDQLKNPGGTADINDKIMPGDSIPFMLVFSDLPQNLENFTVEVAGFENATP